MPPTAVDLGNVTVVQKHSNVRLTLSSSFIIDLPSTWTEPPNAPEISTACSEGSLWIAKAGFCQLDFSVTAVDADSPDDDDDDGNIDPVILSEIISIIADSPIWQDIGLQLRDKHPSLSHDSIPPPGTTTEQDQTNTTTTTHQVSYFLHHPDLSSSIHAPPSTPLALFRALKCHIKITAPSPSPNNVSPSSRRRPPPSGEKDTDTTSGRSDNHPPAANNKKRKKTPHPPQPNPKLYVPQPAHHHGYNLRRNPRATSKVLGQLADVEDLGAGGVCGGKGKKGVRGKRSPVGGGGEEEGDFVVSTVSEVMMMGGGEVEVMLDVALRRLVGVGGCGTRGKGVKVVGGGLLATLIEVAPAVWNLRYLQSVTAHAKVIPSIAGCISRLRNARSASLREKLDKIVCRQQGEESQHVVGIIDEISRRLWLLCQTGIQASPTSKGGPRKEPMNQVVPYEAAVTDPDPREFFPETQAVFPYWETYTEYMMPNMEVYEQVPMNDSDMGFYNENMAMEDDDSASSEFWEVELVDQGTGIEGGEGGLLLETESNNSEVDERTSDGTNDDRDDEEEAEYFYADGYGNVFPIAMGVEDVRYQDPGELEWSSSPILVGAHEVEGEGEGAEDEENEKDMERDLRLWGEPEGGYY